MIDLSPREARIACALLVAQADGRYELSERDVLSAYVSPHEPERELPLNTAEKSGLVIETVLESWGIPIRELLDGGEDPDSEAEEGVGEPGMEEQAAPYRSYIRAVEALERVDRPAEILRSCRQALDGSDQRQETLALVYDVALANGGLKPEEQQTFRTIAKVLGASKQEIQQARETVEELAAWEERLGADDADGLDGPVSAVARTLTPVEATAALVPFALHADQEVDAGALTVIEAYCDRHGIPLETFQEGIREGQQIRNSVGPLGLLSACDEALETAEQREQALELAKEIVRADETVQAQEADYLEILEETLA